MLGRKKIINDDEHAIVTSCQKGDVAAFEVLVKKHQKRMFNIAYRIIGSYEDAVEVVQDAFVSAYKNIKKFRGSAKFTTWLTTIVVNLSKNRIKQMQSRRCKEPVSFDDGIQTEDTATEMNPASSEPSSLEKLERKEIQQRVQWCINTIAEGFREVLVLRDIQGFAYSEISTMLKIPEGTVKSKLYRARDFLKACLKEIFGDLAHAVS